MELKSTGFSVFTGTGWPTFLPPIDGCDKSTVFFLDIASLLYADSSAGVENSILPVVFGHCILRWRISGRGGWAFACLLLLSLLLLSPSNQLGFGEVGVLKCKAPEFKFLLDFCGHGHKFLG